LVTDFDVFIIIPMLDYFIEHYTVHVFVLKRYLENKFYLPYYYSLILLF